MDTVEYLRVLRRMCKSVGSCLECPLGIRGCMGTRDKSAEETIEIVERWAKDHPIRTRQSLFLERYPDAKIDENGVLHICPMLVTSRDCREFRDGCFGCSVCRRKYWEQEVSE